MRYPHAKLRHLEERVAFLSEELYAAMEALDMALGLGAFPATIVTLRDRDAVLRETEEKIRTLMPFKATAFYLVDEGDASFSLVRCYPEEWREFFERERPPLVEDRTIAWALGRRRGVVVGATDGLEQILIHSLATPTGVMGFFLGVLGMKKHEIPDLAMDFLSLTLLSCAGVLESFALNEHIHRLNATLQSHVASLQSSEGELCRYRDQLEEQVRERTGELARANDDLRQEIAERRRAEGELREVLDRYDRLTATAHEAVFRMAFSSDQTSRVVYLNPAAERMLGYSLAEWQEDSLLSEKVFDAESLKKVNALIDRARWGEEGIPSEVIHWRPRDGRSLIVDYSVLPEMDHQGKVLGCEVIARDITERMMLEARFRYQATHDALTGLPSRMLFSDRLALALAHARRNRSMVGLLFLDLDQFKHVNDTLGHDVGDLLLKAVAERLKGEVREMDTVARMGGDEFTVVLPDLGHPDAAGAVAERILEELKRPFVIQDKEIHIGASIGIALYPAHGATVKELMKRADMAMYAAKGAGRGTFRFWREAPPSQRSEAGGIY